MSYQSINPASGQLLNSYAELADSALELAISTAHNCFASWRERGFAERQAVAMKAVGLLRAHVDEHARPMTLEMGKRLAEARGEVLLSAQIIEYYAMHAQEFLGRSLLPIETGRAELQCSPLGVLLGVQPWNFPYYQLARFAAPNLMAGNVVMIKHASCVPMCALAFEQLWRDAGAPAGLYTKLFISHAQIERVISDPRVRGVAFTGSADAGRAVAARASAYLKKSTLELGGNDAFIVLDDADLELALGWALWAKMNNNGQCCIAAKRFIVAESLAQAFTQRLCEALHALQPGNPMDDSTTLAPMASEAALHKLLGQVQRAVANGATLVMGGRRVERPGSYMQPTVLADIKPGNSAFDDELFGPVAMMFRVADDDAAVALANDSSFGLGASIFSRDEARARRLAARLETGMVFINQATWTAPELPFGGMKNSGYGRELSAMGIHEFVNRKLVRVSSAPAPASTLG